MPPGGWPLWRQPLTSPEEVLLALGVWEEGSPAVGEHFPVAAPALAFGRSASGLDFGAEDGTPSDLIFLIASSSQFAVQR